MRLSRSKFVRIFLLASFFVAQAAFASVVGSVIFKTGDVSVTHEDNSVAKAEKNLALNSGDTIETREGRVQFSLIDGGKVSLQPNSIFKINKYEFSGKEDGSEFAFMELVKGGLRTITGLIGHKNRERYQLKTAVATIGIRGTEFTVNFNDNEFLMTTNYGSVDVCGAGGNCLNAITGQSIAVSGPGGAPKFSSKAAKAAAAAPESSKAIFTASDAITGSGMPELIFAGQSLANLNGNSNGNNILVASLMKTSCGCGFDEVFQANVTTNNLSQPTNITTGARNINLASFSSYNDGVVAWGRASSGDFTDVESAGTIEWQDFIFGRTPPPGQLNSLTGTYNVFASTAPIQLNPTTGASTVVGGLNSTTGSFSFNFGTTAYSYNLNVQASGLSYNLANSALLSGLDKNNPIFAAGGAVTGAACVSTSCSQALQGGSNLIQGGFFGLRGERVGLQYGFNAPGGAIYGSAVLK